jgi:hypothetical protein
MKSPTMSIFLINLAQQWKGFNIINNIDIINEQTSCLGPIRGAEPLLAVGKVDWLRHECPCSKERNIIQISCGESRGSQESPQEGSKNGLCEQAPDSRRDDFSSDEVGIGNA